MWRSLCTNTVVFEKDFCWIFRDLKYLFLCINIDTKSHQIVFINRRNRESLEAIRERQLEKDLYKIMFQIQEKLLKKHNITLHNYSFKVIFLWIFASLCNNLYYQQTQNFFNTNKTYAIMYIYPCYWPPVEVGYDAHFSWWFFFLFLILKFFIFPFHIHRYHHFPCFCFYQSHREPLHVSQSCIQLWSDPKCISYPCPVSGCMIAQWHAPQLRWFVWLNICL